MKPLIISFLLLAYPAAYTQPANLNLADPGSGRRVESASSNADMAYRVLTGNMEAGWNTAGEASGAWIMLKFSKAMTVTEIWLLPRPVFSYVITPYSLQHIFAYAPARAITVSFSDSTTGQVLSTSSWITSLGSGHENTTPLTKSEKNSTTM